jgi:hypothetical protein
MMRETVTELDPGWGELLDVDVSESGEWVGVFRDGERLFLRTTAGVGKAPGGIRVPLVRWLDRDRVVLVDKRTEKGRNNAWIYEGHRVIPFPAGDGIQDVLANGDTIVVTYFDEGVFSGIEPGHEGVALFDVRGRLRAGYRSTLGSRAVEVDDCYAACWESESRLAFLPYRGFPLVSLDVRTFDQRVVQTPRAVHGASAMSFSPDGTLFFGAYDDPRSILGWTPGGEIASIGEHVGPLRGLRGGRFVTRGTRGFTILERDA